MSEAITESGAATAAPVLPSPGAGSHEHSAHGEHDAHHLAHHFDTPDQQYQASKLGMWLFLATEILFFGGLFCAYVIYRTLHPEVFIYAHQYLDKYLGAINTGVLIVSSLTMAWGVRCAQLGQQRGLIVCLSLTLLCAFGFLGIKYVEYTKKWSEGLYWGRSYDPNSHAYHELAKELREANPKLTEEQALEQARVQPDNVRIFFSIYFCMTGLHGIHVLGGIGAITWLLYGASKGVYGPKWFTPVDLIGLYWHLVDLIWIYLFPLLYLIH
jgi:cytochrome c oxidase subunit 3